MSERAKPFIPSRVTRLAQGRTISETIEIAKDVAKKLIEAREEQISKLRILTDSFDYPLVIGV